VLGSAAMRDVLSALASHYDHILLDGPPVMLADARILASLVDGVVCSLSALTSRRGVAHECLTTLRRLGARILGVVLVGVKAEHNGYAAMDAALRGYAQAEPAVPQLAAGDPEAATNASDASPTEN